MGDAAIELLRDNGLHVTAQRLAVLQAVDASPHSTADQVADLARGHLGSISRQSVYDTLSVLTDKGVLRRIHPEGSAARYESRVGDNHHHIVCRACGRLEDVECAVGHVPCLTAVQDHGFIIDEAEVVYWGHCPQCQSGHAGSGKSVSASSPPVAAPSDVPTDVSGLRGFGDSGTPASQPSSSTNTMEMS